ncbi:MAG: hypothetical protein AAF436_14720 [Myxococcota bacterium]
MGHAHCQLHVTPSLRRPRESWRRLAILAIACVTLALGCGDSEDAGPTGGTGGQEGPPPASLVGVWTYDSVTVDGAPASLADVLDWVPGAVAAEIQLLETSAYVYQEVDANGAQLWFESGFVFFNDAGEVDVNSLMDSEGEVSETSTFTYTESGDALTLTSVGGPPTVVFVLVR